MATLTNADYGQIRDSVYLPGQGKEEFKALAGGLPTKAQILATFQYLEDQLVGSFATWKAGMESALGRTLTNPGAQKIIAAYLRWKIKQLLGS